MELGQSPGGRCERILKPAPCITFPVEGAQSTRRNCAEGALGRLFASADPGNYLGETY